MNVGNSSAFFLVGLLMSLCPGFVPDSFPVTGPYEDNTSALWLKFMGLLQVVVGGLSMLTVLRVAVREKTHGLRTAFAVLLARLRPRATGMTTRRFVDVPRRPMPVNGEGRIVFILERSAAPFPFGDGIEVWGRWLNGPLRPESVERALEYIRCHGLADQILEAYEWNSAMAACRSRLPFGSPPPSRTYWDARRVARRDPVGAAVGALMPSREIVLSHRTSVCPPDGSGLSTRTLRGHKLWRSITGERWPISSVDHFQAAFSRDPATGDCRGHWPMFSRDFSAFTPSVPQRSLQWSWQFQ